MGAQSPCAVAFQLDFLDKHLHLAVPPCSFSFAATVSQQNPEIHGQVETLQSMR